MTAPINLTTSTAPGSREIDILRARAETLEAALKNLLDANDALYSLPADYNDFQKRKKTHNRAVERSRAALTPTPEPVNQAAPETPTLSPYARARVAQIERQKRDEREGKQ